ncbi:unnamed protein product [Aphanomyces euteiches]|uniref:NET domain-containing protein n=1 Tax=Aphanomyces euteiches TaxID=100861 RepID=A0A6G0XCU1_9STRA|nr:hypothetical protein Ae201684_006012 [Aphanomyces euteiches]KAH9069179.1 hypothetical protein Ae201684P_004869 [Aphanomyces euteiches]KAH9116128.1 hypothetical protein AeMF1_009896 [Aphanomyces euteiches]KAH9151620.1 hypothetical protein AeRB84_005794 [Aphanomyces euteiches]KAH9194741.1 hypothetical protein AeNC1_003291 [Aphanomyces euteiches]
MQVDSYAASIVDVPLSTCDQGRPTHAELEFLVGQINQLPADTVEEMLYIVTAYEPQWMDVLQNSKIVDFDVDSLSPLAIEVMQHYVYTHLACCFVVAMDDAANTTDDEDDDVEM